MKTRLFFLSLTIALALTSQVSDAEVEMSDNFVPPSLTPLEKDKLLACAEIISSKLNLDNVLLNNLENIR
jgi:hypothetical protein